MDRPRIWSREIPIAAWARTARGRPAEVALGVGVALRLLEYSYDRALWLDEGSLVGCIGRIDRVGLFGPLGSTQLAPPGFLAVEWLATRLLGTSTLAYRLVPLVAGIAALFLFRAVAQRILTPRGVFWAVLLFAFTDDLIYYSAEVKQYSSDLALSLLVLWRAGRVDDRATMGVGRSGVLGLGLLGSALIWCSHPLAFTLAAVGLVGLAKAAARRDRPGCAAWAAVGLLWVGCILAARVVGLRQLGHRHDMWAFWDFAFPTWPVASVGDAAWPARRLLFLFANPLNFDGLLGPRWSIAPAVGLAVAGTIRLMRSRPGRLAPLVLPGAFALLAAYARLYPFHGRLLLFWAPLLLILVAAGLDAVANRWARWLLIAWVVGGPSLTAAGNLTGPRVRFNLNPRGDRRPVSLDPSWFPLAPPPSTWLKPPR